MRPKKIHNDYNFLTSIRFNKDDYDFLSLYANKNGLSVSNLIRDLVKSFIIQKKGELSDEDFQSYLNN